MLAIDCCKQLTLTVSCLFYYSIITFLKCNCVSGRLTRRKRFSKELLPEKLLHIFFLKRENSITDSVSYRVYILKAFFFLFSLNHSQGKKMLLLDLIWKYGCIRIFLQESLFIKLLSVPSSSTPIPHTQLKGRGSIPAGYALKWRFPGFPVEFLQTLQIPSCREILIFSKYALQYALSLLRFPHVYSPFFTSLTENLCIVTQSELT